MKKQNDQLGRMLHRIDVTVGRELCQRILQNGMEDVSGTNGRIIRFLADHENEDVYQRDLEREFGITRSTASRVLSLMEQKDLIIRSGVAHDARLKKLTLTEKAQGYSDVMRRNAREMNVRLLKGFTEEETQQLYAYLERLQENLSR